jgi:L-methionine (R)-S-oxide reductase
MTHHNEAAQSWLATFLSEAGAVAGTVHLHENGGLRLAACQNIPEKVQEIVAWVPSGKGMAGLALERGVPVQTCNLQEDRSGAVKPGARAVDARAAVALPVRNHHGLIVAVVGAAFADDREIAGTELERLQGASASLATLTEGIAI